MKRHLLWTVPLLSFLVLTPFTPSLDLTIASYFYIPPSEGMPHRFSQSDFFQFFRSYGDKPGFAVVFAASVLYLLTFFKKRIHRWRRGALVVLLSLFLGAGLTNGLLKMFWARPRPKQVENFGGKYPFHPYYSPNWDTDRFIHEACNRTYPKSFPSGHTAMGFCYLAICVIAHYYRSRPWMIFGIFMTVTLGPLLAISRLAQGAHFLSDTLFAALLMWYTSLFCGWLVFTSEGWGRLEWVRGEAIHGTLPPLRGASKV